MTVEGTRYGFAEFAVFAAASAGAGVSRVQDIAAARRLQGERGLVVLPKALRTPQTDQLAADFLSGDRSAARAARGQLARAGATIVSPMERIGGSHNRTLQAQATAASVVAPFTFTAAETVELNPRDNPALFHATGASRVTVERNDRIDRVTRSVRGTRAGVIGQADLAQHASTGLAAIVLRSPNGLNHDVSSVFVSVDTDHGPHVLTADTEASPYAPPQGPDSAQQRGPVTAADRAKDIGVSTLRISTVLGRRALKKAVGDVVGDAVEHGSKAVVSEVGKVAGAGARKQADALADKAGDKLSDTVADKVDTAVSSMAPPAAPDRARFAAYVCPPDAGTLEGRQFTFVQAVSQLDTTAPDVEYQQQRAALASAARKTVGDRVRMAEDGLRAAGVREADVRTWAAAARAAAQAEVSSRLQVADGWRLLGRPLGPTDRALLLTSDGPAQLAHQAMLAIPAHS